MTLSVKQVKPVTLDILHSESEKVRSVIGAVPVFVTVIVHSIVSP